MGDKNRRKNKPNVDAEKPTGFPVRSEAAATKPRYRRYRGVTPVCIRETLTRLDLVGGARSRHVGAADGATSRMRLPTKTQRNMYRARREVRPLPKGFPFVLFFFSSPPLRPDVFPPRNLLARAGRPAPRTTTPTAGAVVFGVRAMPRLAAGARGASRPQIVPHVYIRGLLIYIVTYGICIVYMYIMKF